MGRSTAFLCALLTLTAIETASLRAEIRIATAAPMSGPYAWSGEQYRLGSEMAVQDVNAAFGSLSGRDQDDLLSTDYSELWVEEDKSDVAAELGRLSEGGEERSEQTRNLRMKDGSLRAVSVVTALARTAGSGNSRQRWIPSVKADGIRLGRALAIAPSRVRRTGADVARSLSSAAIRVSIGPAPVNRAS